MEIDTSMHDRPEQGNAPMSAALYGDLAICPEKKCPSFGAHFKCYIPCFTRCNEYTNNNDPRPSKIDAGLVEVVD